MNDYIVVGMWIQGFVGMAITLLYFKFKGFKNYSQLNGFLYAVIFGFLTIPISLFFTGNIFERNDFVFSLLISSFCGVAGSHLGYNLSYFFFKKKI